MKTQHKISIFSVLLVFSGWASASTVTIGFDGLTGGSSDYTESGYKFDPVSFNNPAPQCGLNPPCIKESRQGEITTMTRVDGGSFNLLSFFFHMQGTGSGPNFVTVFNTSDSFTYTLGSAGYDNLFHYPAGGPVGAAVGIAETLGDSGYLAVFAIADFGEGETSIKWESSGSANARIDDIGVDDLGVSPVPVPAAVWLFGTAMIGFIGLSRRKKV